MTAPRPPRLVAAQQIQRMLGLSRSYTAQLVNTKGFPDPWTTIGTMRIWLAKDVEAWAQSAGRELHEEET